MKLILFDIDGTLLSVDHNVTHSVVHATLVDSIGHNGVLPEYEFSGKTDWRILLDLAGLAGIRRHDAEPMLMSMKHAMHRRWEGALEPHHVTVHEGVHEVLDLIASSPNVACGLLTGNLEPCARVKLERAGINQYFPIGAFGSDAEERNDLPPIALRRAREHYGVDFDVADTLIIGDSHRDIRCARAWGMKSLAVATGRLSESELSRYMPDAVVSSLKDDRFVRWFVGLESSPV